MLKKLFFVAAVLGGLSLSPAVESRADSLAAPKPLKEPGSVKKTVQVEMKGQFLFRADHLDILLPDSRLIVNGRTYVVDLSTHRDLWSMATALDGHNAVVTGTLNGDTITATAIKGDTDFAHKTIKVEVKGHLIWNRPMRCMMTQFSVCTAEEYFGLEFANANLEKLAGELADQTVVLSGTLEENTFRGNIITVTELKAAELPKVPEKVSVAVQGKLQFVIKHFLTGEVLFTCDELPADFSRSWSLGYGVTIDGRLYQFDLSSNAKLLEQVEKLIGHSVLAEGTLKKDVVLVTSLKPLS